MQRSTQQKQQKRTGTIGRSQPGPVESTFPSVSATLFRCALFVTAIVLLSSLPQSALAQASPTATRAGDLQVGGGFSLARPDYTRDTFRGFTFYSSFDFKEHFGVEVDFHQVNHPSPSTLYERTYEVGGRYVRHYGIVNPYARLMYGRGVFNYEGDVANLAYNMGVIGAGADFNVSRRINVRADYEYQRWVHFRGFISGNVLGDNNHALTPQVFTIGAAYHFQ